MMAIGSARGVVFILVAVALAATVSFLLLQGGGEVDPGSNLPEVVLPDEPETASPEAHTGSETAAGQTERTEILVAEEAPLNDGPPVSYTEALGGLIGRVVEVDGTPVADLEIELIGASMDDVLGNPAQFFASEIPAPAFTQGRATTDEAGRFRFTGVQVRAIHALLLDSGGPRSTIRFVDSLPNSGEDGDLGDVVLDPYVIFTGKVVDQDGAPIPDARVRATDLPAIIFEAGVENLRPDGGVVLHNPRLGSKVGRPPNIVFRFPRSVWRFIEKFPIPTTYTAEDGSFTLAGVPEGLVSVLVDKDAYVTKVHGPVPTGVAGGERSIGTIRVDHGELLTGTVVDMAGDAVAGAEVLVGRQIELTDEVTLVWAIGATDGGGRFSGGGLADEEHVVAVRAPDSLDWVVVKDIVPGSDEPVIRLPIGYDVTVRAFDPKGVVVADLQICITPEMEEPGRIPMLREKPLPQARIIHGEDGSATVERLGASVYSLLVRAEGFAAAREMADLTQGSREIRVSLQPAKGIEVQVLRAADGTPVQYACVKALPVDEGSLELQAEALARTDQNGLARLDGLRDEPYRIVAEHPAYAAAVVQTSFEEPRVTVELAQGGSIKGRVHANGKPPDAPRFIGIGQEDMVNIPRFRVTDLEGGFHVTNLRPGKHELIIMRRFAHEQGLGGFSSSFFNMMMPEREMEVQVAEGEETEVSIDLLGTDGDGPTARLMGRVTLNGQPAVRATVLAVTPGSFRSRKNSVTDENGDFDFGEIALAEGSRVYLTVTPKGVPQESWFGGGFYSRWYRLTQGQSRHVTINLQTGGLRGRVVTSAGGTPLAGCSVTVRTEGGGGGGLWGGSDDDDGKPEPAEGESEHRAQTDKTGAFEITMLPAGEFMVLAEAEGYTDGSVGPIRVPVGGEPSPVLIRLDAAIVVTGKVVLQGVDAPDWVWMNFLKEGTEQSVGVSATGDDLSFRTDKLAPGNWTVQVGCWDEATEEYSSYEARVRIPADGVTGLVIEGQLKAD
ncbi:MAG: carboxypeptidase regulatory-like domain-containing protein [Planctomycetota bacterium]